MSSVSDLRSKVSQIQKQYDKEGQIFYNKIKFKNKLLANGISVPETYAFLSNKSDISGIKNLNEFVMKPNFAAQGQDVYCIERKGEIYIEVDGRKHDWDFIRGKILNMIKIHKFVLVEERIYNPPGFKDLLCRINGIVDIRMYMLDDQVLFGKMRVPLNRSEGYANTGRRATAMFVDIAGYVRNDITFNNTSTIHPESGRDFAGWYVPHWESLYKTAIEAAKLFDIPFHSIDITCGYDSHTGAYKPVIIESEKIPLLSHFTEQGCKEVINRIDKYIHHGPVA